MEVLERMGERVAAMGLKCGERRLHQLANVFGEMRHPETVFSHFRLDAHEQETLFCFMQEEVEKLGDVRNCMERLNTLRSLLRKKKPAPATSLLSELQAASAYVSVPPFAFRSLGVFHPLWVTRCVLMCVSLCTPTVPHSSTALSSLPPPSCRCSLTRSSLLHCFSPPSPFLPHTPTSLPIPVCNSDALADGEGKEEAEKEGDSSSWMPRCDLPGAEEILKLLLVLAIILLRDRIISVFAINARSSDALTREGSLGRAGLALRYAKVINLAEKLMKYPFMAAGSTRIPFPTQPLPRLLLPLLKTSCPMASNITAALLFPSPPLPPLSLFPCVQRRAVRPPDLHDQERRCNASADALASLPRPTPSPLPPIAVSPSTRDELYGLLTSPCGYPSFSFAPCFPSCTSYSCLSPSRDELYGLLTYSTKKDLALRLSRPVTSSKSKETKAEETTSPQTSKGAGKNAEKGKDGEEDEEDDDDDGFTWLKKPSPLNDPRCLGGKGGGGNGGEEEEDEDMEEWERRMRKALSLLPLLAQHTIAWNDAITVKPSSNRKATRLLRVQVRRYSLIVSFLSHCFVSAFSLSLTHTHPPIAPCFAPSLSRPLSWSLGRPEVYTVALPSNPNPSPPPLPRPPPHAPRTLYHTQKAGGDELLLNALCPTSSPLMRPTSRSSTPLLHPLLPPPSLSTSQTLYHAQKAVIDASLLDALEGVSRLVASDASNLTQLNSRKMEAMAAEARKKLDKTSADSKKPRVVMISGIFKPKRAAAGIVHGAPLPMVFEPATEVGKVTEKGKAPELSPRGAVPLSPTGASAAEPAASFLVKSGSVSAPRSVSPAPAPAAAAAAAAAAAGAASARTRFPTSASVSVAGSSASPYRSSDLSQKALRPLPALPAAADASTPGQTAALPSPSLLAQSLLSTSSLPSSQLSSLEAVPPPPPPPSATLPTTPPDSLGSPKSPLKPRPPSQPPVRPPFRGSAANSVDLSVGGDNPRSPRGVVRAAAEASGGSAGAGNLDGPPRSPRAYVHFADPPAGLGGECSGSSSSGSGDRAEAAAVGGFREGATRDGSSSPASPHGLSRLSPSTPPNSNTTDSSHANRPVSPLGQSHRSTPSITIIPPSHSRVSSTFRAPVPPALLSPTCVIYDATPKSPAPVASLQRLNARKETRDEPFVTTEGLLAQAQAQAEAETLKAQALKAQAMQAQAEVVKAHALKVKALKAQAQAVKAQAEADGDVQAQAVPQLQAQVSFSLDRSIGQDSQSASTESPKTRPAAAPASAASAAAASAAASTHLLLSASPSAPLAVSQPTSSSSPRPSTAPSSSSRPTTPSSRPTTPSSRPTTPPLKTSLPFLLGTSSRPTTPPMLGTSSSVSSGSIMSSRPSDAVTCECRTGLGLRRDRLRNVWVERDDEEDWDGEGDREGYGEGDGRSLRDGAGGGATPPRSRRNSISRSIGGALRVLQRGMSEQERGRHSSLRGSNLRGQGSGLGGGGGGGVGGGGSDGSGDGGSGGGVGSSATGGGTSGSGGAAGGRAISAAPAAAGASDVVNAAAGGNASGTVSAAAGGNASGAVSAAAAGTASGAGRVTAAGAMSAGPSGGSGGPAASGFRSRS
ncbi:unnamed protein product, partial [Closterium sp. NIES-54]